MPVELSVKEIREELSRAAVAGDAGTGEPSTRLLGRLFHEVFADLVGRDPQRSGLRVALEAGRDEGPERLVEHVYRALVGPRLSRERAHLGQTTAQVLAFWRAAEELSRWLGELAWTVAEARRDTPTSWEDVAARITAEAALSCEIREPGWTDSVRLVGVADSLVRVPGRAELCVVELKLGRARPAVDLGQAALYRLIASRSEHAGEARGASSIALLRFSPALEETLIGAEAPGLREAEARLFDLIARMAGVAAPAPTAPRPAARYGDLGQKLVRAYREYGRAVEIAGEPTVGPRFLRFEARLGRGVTFDQLNRLTTEIHLKVGLGKEPILTKVGGRLCIDVERPDPQIVRFSDVAPELARGPRGSARLPIGVDLGGALHTADLSSPVHAHVLVAGTTGSGKTEWLRMAIAGLIHQNTPDTLRLVLLDPKLAAFTELGRSRFLWAKHGLWVPGEGTDVVEVLDDLVVEMDRRYRLLRDAGTDDLDRYLARTGATLPRIVCFCDEYFALVSQDRQQKKAIEGAIALLGAKARAAGIHLVIATQQPSRQIIQGALDANMPCRVGLLTQSAIESRMLLQASGAERLTGFGDLLYKDIGEPIRLQAPYVTPEERAKLFG